MSLNKTVILEDVIQEQKDDIELVGSDSEDVKDAADITGRIGKWQIGIFVSVIFIQFVSMSMFSLSIYLFPSKVDFRCDRNQSNSSDECWTNTNGTREKCTTWTFDKSIYSWTLLEKWSLVCDKDWILSFSLSFMLFGKLLGSLVAGVLGDKYGRRNVMLMTLPPAIIMNSLCFAAPEVFSFLICQCISAGAGYIIHSSSYILLMEVMSPKTRSVATILAYIGQISASVYLAVIGFTVGDWRYIQLAVTIPVCVLPLLIWVLPESPRWLIINNRLEAAQRTLEKALRMNKRSTDGLEEKLSLLYERLTIDAKETKKNFTPLDIFRSSDLRNRTILLLIVWATFGVVFFSFQVNVTVFGGNLAGVVSMAIAEIPGTLLAGAVTPRTGSRSATMIGLALLALTSLACSFTAESSFWVQMALVCLVKTEGIFIANILFVLSAEVFPTVVRAIGIGLCLTTTKTVSLATPYIKEMKNNLGYSVPFWMFTAFAIVATVTTVFLRVPHSDVLPETLEDVGKDSSRKDKIKTIKPS